MPDVSRAGGITGVLKILALAQAWGVEWSLHSYGSDVGLAASLHIMAALPGGLRMLKDVSDAPARSGILVHPVQTEGGDALVPQGPGLGVELDPGALSDGAGMPAEEDEGRLKEAGKPEEEAHGEEGASSVGLLLQRSGRKRGHSARMAAAHRG